MFIARLAGVLLLIALAVFVAAYLFTRDRRYLRWARMMLQFAFAFACAFMALYIAERLMLVI
jgi:hypothetical protein